MENANQMAAGGFAVMGMFFAFFLIFGLAVYAYIAVCLQKIANKTGTKDSWLAWIPIGNLYLLSQIAKKEWWWTLLCLVPFLGIIIIIILFVEIAKILGKPEWTGILMIVPVVNLIVLGYLAFSDKESKAVGA